ncbi:MAG: Deoxyribodipyrimidine photo-lyase [Bacteroidetes bacterium]|nr:Deoxyribodipyrimidine photo-lyase [Bacteroidota bacterium]
MKDSITVFWLRRDLRLHDNAGLYHALRNNKNVLLLFIFDAVILSELQDAYDRRIDFIHQAIQKINIELSNFRTSVKVVCSTPLEAFKELTDEYKIKNVYLNHDYEPYALERDEEIKLFLSQLNISFFTFKDQCIFEKKEITKNDGKPYTVFTPYSRKWKSKLSSYYLKAYPNKKYFTNFLKTGPFSLVTLEELKFKKTDVVLQNEIIVNGFLLRDYKNNRDFPSVTGTSRLSIHLRFGTISVRQLAAQALANSETFLNELIWRDFYMMILSNFPHVAKGAFKKEYDHISWRNKEDEFKKWCEGITGFPIVDAGMRELNSTGFMHNRVRMIVSSFLIKDLLIDWRWGEAYFAHKLNDYDLSANNGGWQWAAGSGCDAAPYFRVFNPTEQQKKFDPEFKYIKQWVAEFGTKNYPEPMVDHASSRLRALKVYKECLNEHKQMKLF